MAIASLALATACGQRPDATPARTASHDRAIARDLLDVNVPRLHQLHADHTYTVVQAVQWHLDRIDRYNPIYGAIETVVWLHRAWA